MLQGLCAEKTGVEPVNDNGWPSCLERDIEAEDGRDPCWSRFKKLEICGVIVEKGGIPILSLHSVDTLILISR